MKEKGNKKTTLEWVELASSPPIRIPSLPQLSPTIYTLYSYHT